MNALMEKCRPGSAWIRGVKGGVVLSVTIALAATSLSGRYGAPAMLFALLLGMACNFMADNPRAEPGVAFCSTTLLRIGVALLGLRLTFGDIAQLGVAPMLGVGGLPLVTLGSGVVTARAFGRPPAFGLLTGGAVAICGASAALAIAATLPKRHVRHEDVLLTVVGVTTLSTVAMILYPVLFAALGLSEIKSGYLIGATVHDVAQVVGAGYSIGENAGDIATFTKLLRVALLPIVLIAIGLSYRNERGGPAKLPWFVVAFVVLMVLRNVAPLPEALLNATDQTSQFMLLTAIAALGVKTSLGRLCSTGLGGFAVIGVQTLILLVLALSFTYGFFV